jgi:para-nitrobenzyl esterase
MSVGTLLAMPAARGLFHKAIPQSGACHSGTPLARANRIAERVLSRIGASPRDADALRRLTPAQLLTGTLLPDGNPDPEFGMAYQPVLDGSVVPRTPIELVAGGSASGVAVMVGSTLDEWKLFAIMDASIRTLDLAGLGARFSRRLTAPGADALIETYRNARASRGESITPADLFCAIETDRVFRIPGVRLAQVQARHDARVYSYLFTWPSPAIQGLLGSCHALELGFVFGTNHVPGMSGFAGRGPAADQLATQMQDAWLAFARTGDPTCASAGAWTAYTDARRSTMVFGATTRLDDAPRDEERRAWDAFADRVIGSL